MPNTTQPLEPWQERYNTAIREFLTENAEFIDPNRFSQHRLPDEPEDARASTFGWRTHDRQHGGEGGGECGLVIPAGATVTERTYSVFEGTFVDNEDEVGLNVHPVSCNCGTVTDGYARWVGSMAELVEHFTGGNQPSIVLH